MGGLGVRGARASSSPTTTPPTSLAHLGPALDDTDQDCPSNGLCHPELWAWTDGSRLALGPLLTPGKGISKFKPRTLDLCQR